MLNAIPIPIPPKKPPIRTLTNKSLINGSGGIGIIIKNSELIVTANKVRIKNVLLILLYAIKNKGIFIK